MPLEIVTIPCLKDNYAYLVHDPATDTTTVVDAPEAGPILRTLYERGWKLSHVLITHHHADHIDGVPMLEAATGARVIGAEVDVGRLPALTESVRPGDVIPIGMQMVEVIDAPGHTLGHIAWYFSSAGLVFTGDSLMSWGCGRLFEGTAAQMWETLQQLSALPPETLICSGHEYTEANGRFALSLEPDNPALLARMAAVRDARAKGEPTVPVTLALELATNPFLRASDPVMKALLELQGAPDVEVFAALRNRKDRF
ncbi:hydroxyacylglutathione hydrolase [Phaeovulum sp.]|uniref:hydroxyacylglutathione hydrolase n=1 Tax=Phaeovulum sp. TaxID=2934796 RepID=UPI0039E39E26